MKTNGLSKSHINNTLKTNMLFSEFLQAGVSFFDVKKQRRNNQFLRFKNEESRTLRNYKRAARS
jgi:hypothetical protein